MTKEEIAAMIAAKIEGQGTNVDAGSALPAILNGILELIPEPTPTPSGPTVRIFDVTVSGQSFYGDGISDRLIKEWMAAGDITIIHWTSDSSEFYSMVNTYGEGGMCLAYNPLTTAWMGCD